MMPALPCQVPHAPRGTVRKSRRRRRQRRLNPVLRKRLSPHQRTVRRKQRTSRPPASTSRCCVRCLQMRRPSCRKRTPRKKKRSTFLWISWRDCRGTSTTSPSRPSLQRSRAVRTCKPSGSASVTLRGLWRTTMPTWRGSSPMHTSITPTLQSASLLAATGPLPAQGSRALRAVAPLLTPWHFLSGLAAHQACSWSLQIWGLPYRPPRTRPLPLTVVLGSIQPLQTLLRMHHTVPCLSGPLLSHWSACPCGRTGTAHSNPLAKCCLIPFPTLMCRHHIPPPACFPVLSPASHL
mmetsp:Transcript_32723/g.58683  ORF Transcript_32723/g.58683 Transcript_32723/m.58683 type:complete len:293 (-) Transcript_32723:2945-3823(-)